MRRELNYRGKNIKEMTISELKNQFTMNKTRLIYRTIFFILIALSIMVYEPIAVIIPFGFAMITGYWLIENNKEILKEIESR